MSGVNIRYEIASAGGEIACVEETSLNKKDAPNLANVIAGEIVNEILENALNIAANSSDSGLHWNEIKESRSTQSVNTPLAISLEGKLGKMENTCSNTVGDNVDHVETASPANMGEIMDGLNKISVNQDAPQDTQDVDPLDIEMKKLLNEMLSPPYEIVNYETVPGKGGIGDQPSDDKSERLINEPVVEPEVTRTVEKKSRLTDLVKNSPQIITEYLMMDTKVKQNQEEWEVAEEKLVQVIELDHVKPGEELYRVRKTVVPETIALPEDDNESELILIPSDDVMDIVDLSPEVFKNEEQQLSSTNQNGSGAKGDEHQQGNVCAVSQNETISSDGKMIEDMCLFDQKQISQSEKDPNVKESKLKKRKWNIGNKLWGFLRKGHKQQD